MNNYWERDKDNHRMHYDPDTWRNNAFSNISIKNNIRNGLLVSITFPI